MVVWQPRVQDVSEGWLCSDMVANMARPAAVAMQAPRSHMAVPMPRPCAEGLTTSPWKQRPLAKQKVVAYKCVSLSDSEHDERSAAVKSAQGGQREGMGVEVGHAVLRECHQKAVKISQICFLQGREAESGE